jgi:hypothetical protein
MMNELLANPAIQAAVAPFFVAVAIALIFRRFGVVAFGFAIIAGLLTTLMLTTGLALFPLTSTRKIILSSLCLPFVVLLMDVIWGRLPNARQRWATIILVVVPTVLLVAAANWVIWPVLQRQEISEAWPMLARVSLYVGVLSIALLGMARLNHPDKSTAQGASVLVLGLGTAVTSMIAASALYAQLAFSVTAAVGATLLINLFAKTSGEGKQDVGYLGLFALFTAAAPLALIGAAATVYAQLPGWALLCLVAVPLFAGWPTIKVERPFLRLTVTCLLALVPVIPAVWLAWRAAEAVSY